MKWKPSYRFYKGCFCVARAILSIFYWFDIKGRENIPSGAAMVCSNHSSLIDPLFIAFAFGIGCYLHFIAKIELYSIPILSAVIIKLGAISVDREMKDVATIKNTLKCFKNGEKVAIFPEGTRNPQGDTVAAKFGAVKIAERTGVPLIPIFVPRKKRLFSKISMVIGKPYKIEKQSEKRSAEEYALLSDALMEKIEALNPARSQ